MLPYSLPQGSKRRILPFHGCLTRDMDIRFRKTGVGEDQKTGSMGDKATTYSICIDSTSSSKTRLFIIGAIMPLALDCSGWQGFPDRLNHTTRS